MTNTSETPSSPEHPNITIDLNKEIYTSNSEYPIFFNTHTFEVPNKRRSLFIEINPLLDPSPLVAINSISETKTVQDIWNHLLHEIHFYASKPIQESDFSPIPLHNNPDTLFLSQCPQQLAYAFKAAYFIDMFNLRAKLESEAGIIRPYTPETYFIGINNKSHPFLSLYTSGYRELIVFDPDQERFHYLSDVPAKNRRKYLSKTGLRYDSITKTVY
jgi:hypothetical protein